jgi:hypothetical protein
VMRLLNDFRVWLDESPLWRFVLVIAVLGLAVTSIATIIVQLLSPVPDPVFFAVSTAAALTAWQAWVRHRDRAERR